MIHFKLLPALVLTAGSFFYTTAIRAQVAAIDNETLVELMEHRSHEQTELEQQLSNTSNYISLAIPISIALRGAIRGEKVTFQKGIYIAESIAVSSLFTMAIKNTVNRQRPFIADPRIVPEGSGGSPSFPSGHTSQVFATATALAIAYPKWYVIVPAYTWAGSVGYSRMYLGVHYPSDVIAGALTGACSAWLTYKGNVWLHGRKHHASPLTW